MTDPSPRPRAFLSFGREDKAHDAWVRGLADRLRADGVDVTLDETHFRPGTSLPANMERAIRDCEVVLIVCTPAYKDKAHLRQGGVGYEWDLIDREINDEGISGRHIPLLRVGDRGNAIPTRLHAVLHVDLRQDPEEKSGYTLLRDTLLGRRPWGDPDLRLDSGLVEPGLDPSPVTLLGSRAIPWSGATEIDALDTWRTQPVHAAMLVVGAGGIGKTRLLAEWFERLRQRGIQAGFVPSDRGEDLIAGLTRPGERIVAVDDAETRVPLLRRLLGVQLQRTSHGQGGLRLVILARSAEAWWNALEREGAVQHETLTYRTLRLSLPDLPLAERAAVFAQAVQIYSVFTLPAQPRLAPPALSEPHFGQRLYIQMAALAWIDGKRIEQARALVAHTAAREASFAWRTLDSLSVPASVLEQVRALFPRAVVVIGIQGGIDDPSEGRALLSALHGDAPLSDGVVRATWEVLRRLYGWGDGVRPMKPELLLDQMYATVFKEEPELLDRATGGGHGPLVRTLGAVNRISVWEPAAERWIARLLRGALAERMDLALDVALQQTGALDRVLASLLDEAKDARAAQTIVRRCAALGEVPLGWLAVGRVAYRIAAEAAQGLDAALLRHDLGGIAFSNKKIAGEAKYVDREAYFTDAIEILHRNPGGERWMALLWLALADVRWNVQNDASPLEDVLVGLLAPDSALHDAPSMVLKAVVCVAATLEASIEEASEAMDSLARLFQAASAKEGEVQTPRQRVASALAAAALCHRANEAGRVEEGARWADLAWHNAVCSGVEPGDPDAGDAAYTTHTGAWGALLAGNTKDAAFRSARAARLAVESRLGPTMAAHFEEMAALIEVLQQTEECVYQQLARVDPDVHKILANAVARANMILSRLASHDESFTYDMRYRLVASRWMCVLMILCCMVLVRTRIPEPLWARIASGICLTITSSSPTVLLRWGYREISKECLEDVDALQTIPLTGSERQIMDALIDSAQGRIMRFLVFSWSETQGFRAEFWLRTKGTPLLEPSLTLRSLPFLTLSARLPLLWRPGVT